LKEKTKKSLLGYGEEEVGVSSVWEEGVYLVKFVWRRASVKAGQPDYLDQQKCDPKMNGQLW